ncbi:MAG: phosphatidylserine decarboxylase [Deltaproteobacteria bacterium]|nr:phosphatidylserine decarboxylase [Deltaproteobacteria bacterium]
MERIVAELVSVRALSHTTGHLADLRLPRQVLERAMLAYIRAYDVDMSDVAEPLSAFETFNAFFTRALRPGARPIDPGENTIVSPADSRVHEMGRVPTHGMLEQVKGRRYRLGALLGDEGEAGAFREGVYANLYLSPRDYHRVHCPVDGHILSWRHIPGRLYPVNNLAMRAIDGLYATNERVVVHFDSPGFGRVALVFVGATNVGRITLSFTDQPGAWNSRGPTTVTPREPIAIARGDELGMFNLGSTVVLLVADPKLVPASVLAGEHVAMGRGLWRR